MPLFPKTPFEAGLGVFGEDADILTVRHAETQVASVLSRYWRGTVMPYWGGGTFAARGLRANELMYYALMNHARAQGCSRFDFGRSKVGSGPWSYKKHSGSEERRVGQECVSPCRFRGSPHHYKTNSKKEHVARGTRRGVT